MLVTHSSKKIDTNKIMRNVSNNRDLLLVVDSVGKLTNLKFLQAICNVTISTRTNVSLYELVC